MKIYYYKIINRASLKQAPLLMAMQTSLPVQEEVRKFVAGYFREHGLTPQKIVFSEVWRVYCNPKNANSFLKAAVKKLGFELVISDRVSELADNVQVNVQMVEINKNYFKKIGINWPTPLKTQEKPKYWLLLSCSAGAAKRPNFLPVENFRLR